MKSLVYKGPWESIGFDLQDGVRIIFKYETPLSVDDELADRLLSEGHNLKLVSENYISSESKKSSINTGS